MAEWWSRVYHLPPDRDTAYYMLRGYLHTLQKEGTIWDWTTQEDIEDRFAIQVNIRMSGETALLVLPAIRQAIDNMLLNFIVQPKSYWEWLKRPAV